ncbi:B12-binding domain-containing radical SAM protein [Caloranaerobacter ferrireducens]|uniref:B12-binding domain-containing radical SAM protein n=1 Tax=Caloranaerobacter ferrireducens TaxID=1323370 RepID=UPI00084D0AE6|nr:radical SAM protein [Caloranaerobacter ferrireducens]
MNSDYIDVLLVNAPSPHPGSIISYRIQGVPPLGLGYIGTYLEKKGYKVKILDFYIDEITILDLKLIVNELHPKIVAISTTTETYNNGVKIADYSKKLDENIITIMGGCHVTFEYENALNTGFIDIVVRNEGEFVMKELCDYYIKKQGKLENIKGICYKRGGKIIKNNRREFIKDLDSLPFPDRSLYQLEKYPIPGTISTSRGCPGRCIFCAATALSGGKYRIRSVENIIDEIKYLKELGISYVQIVDDTFTADVDRLYKFLEILDKENLGITWGCESRVDIMNKELLNFMKKCGCISIQFGVEAGSQEMLDCLKKNITIEQIRNVFLWAREIDIKTGTCLMIGQPYDTLESIQKTIEFATEIQSYGARVVLSVTTPFPGTYMYNNPEKVGIHIVDKNFDNYNTFTPVYDTKHFKREDIRRNYYDAIIKLGRGLNDSKKKEEYRQWREFVKAKAEIL